MIWYCCSIFDFKWFDMILLFNLQLQFPKPKQYLSEKFDVVTKFWGKNYFQKILQKSWKEDVLYSYTTEILFTLSWASSLIVRLMILFVQEMPRVEIGWMENCQIFFKWMNSKGGLWVMYNQRIFNKEPAATRVNFLCQGLLTWQRQGLKKLELIAPCTACSNYLLQVLNRPGVGINGRLEFAELFDKRGRVGKSSCNA